MLFSSSTINFFLLTKKKQICNQSFVQDLYFLTFFKILAEIYGELNLNC